MRERDDRLAIQTPGKRGWASEELTPPTWVQRGYVGSERGYVGTWLRGFSVVTWVQSVVTWVQRGYVGSERGYVGTWLRGFDKNLGLRKFIVRFVLI